MMNIDYLERMVIDRQREIQTQLSRPKLEKEAAPCRPAPLLLGAPCSLRARVGIFLIGLGARLAA